MGMKYLKQKEMKVQRMDKVNEGRDSSFRNVFVKQTRVASLKYEMLCIFNKA